MIEAPPAAGKTTRVPPALLSLGSGVLVLEPRRIAARMAARQVAAELGEKVGETVGYQVRFEDVASPRTRLRFVTEGVLTRRLLSDSTLSGIGVVVLDEFHERHLETDLALALLRRLQLTTRPDLKLVVMSATLSAGPLAHFLDDCPVLRSEGRIFPLEIAHVPYSPAPLEEQVASAVERVVTGSSEGDVLVFLPGSAEIRRAARACESLADRHGLLLTSLSGDLSAAEQDRAVAPAGRRKVVLSTNVAESSITIEGVTAVIDSGLARFARDSPWTGFPTLEVARVSQASANQRAGRAGRTRPGRVIRLYTAEDFHRRVEHDPPEIARRELSQMCLQLNALGIAHPGELAWLETPPEAAINAANALLLRLKAHGPEAGKMARLPLHPRLARLVLEAEKRGAPDAGCAAAALLSSGQRFASTDLLRVLEGQWDARTIAVYQQIRRVARAGRGLAAPDALEISVLAAFPDRVARRRADGQILLAGGGSALLADPPGEFLVAVDIEDRSDRARPLVRVASRIEPEWLMDLFPERLSERNSVEWNRSAERVENVSALLYDDLVIEETRGGSGSADAAAALLADKVLDAGVARFVDVAELEGFLARVDFASQHSAIEPPGENAVIDALREVCFGLRSFAEVTQAAGGLVAALARQVNTRLLNEVAPDRLRLPSGRQTRVHYERGKAPWVSSRLQDFFGMRESPRVGGGKVPLVLHLLAPNQRAVQMTTDLAGFWERLYPQLRRELGRRYPRHAWPESPC